MASIGFAKLSDYNHVKHATISGDIYKLAKSSIDGAEISKNMLDMLEKQSFYRFKFVEENSFMTLALLKRLVERAKIAQGEALPKRQRWDSNLGRLICPRVWFSSDLMVWIAQSYEPDTRPFRRKDGSITFSMSPSTISRVFKLRPSAQKLNKK